MVVVVAVLAVAAAIVIPKADVASPAIVDAAASRVANALRFARREAMRTGAYHVVLLDTAAQTLRVYRLTTSGAVAEDTSTPVLHPVDMRTYNIGFANDPAGSATIVSAIFKYQSGATTAYAAFGPDGAPADAHGLWTPTLFVADPLQTDGVVTLNRGGVVKTVTVAASTGRVTS
jgi:Tfp pilus assembly protein FimT